MSKPLISILLPVRNASKYLRECLDSIIVQTESSWELIAVDDHSEDNSYAILKTYAEKEERIKVLKNNGKGIIPALRKAYSGSQGNLITRMDADDVMFPGKLENLQAILLKSGKGHLATGLVEYFSAEGLGDGYLKYQNWLNTLSREEANFSDIYKECVIPSPCWMVFREDLNRCGAFEPNIYPEDYDLCFRFYKNGLRVKAALEYLHRWRDYAERTSRNDPNYADVHFFELKLRYFLEIDHRSERPLILWGAGHKGKKLAKMLKGQIIPFHWITGNPQKIGKDIYGIILQPESLLENISNPQIIISIAAPEALVKIRKKMKQFDYNLSEDYFYFC